MNSIFYEKSIAVILNNQDRNGGYIACPNFKQYQYYWFRDGSFIAYAMDIAGQLHSAERYHTWAINTILLNKMKLNNVINKKKTGSIDASIDFFHCRFNADGSDADGEWAYHQLDGLGAWLWSFGNHCRIEGVTQLSNEQAEAINLVYSYLQTLWDTPCYDCWEEDMNSVHTYTLAAIYGGLQTINRVYPLQGLPDLNNEIHEYILRYLFKNGKFQKSTSNQGIDANLLGLFVPFNVFSKDNDGFQKTLKKIESDLLTQKHGLHRYREDTYYGGGEWILLSAWLGWVYANQEKTYQAIEMLQWVETQFTDEGFLAEQTGNNLFHSTFLDVWQNKWGPIASPLLWSHAMHIILFQAINKDLGER